MKWMNLYEHQVMSPTVVTSLTVFTSCSVFGSICANDKNNYTRNISNYSKETLKKQYDIYNACSFLSPVQHWNSHMVSHHTKQGIQACSFISSVTLKENHNFVIKYFKILSIHCFINNWQLLLKYTYMITDPFNVTMTELAVHINWQVRL
jgi:hypothetical protein